ncbi:hypothetical protein QFC19_009214 [Naganishia cerealis]|uniref:Uncharacterized protein n=1 Tax=Naganishia cerealis TaxID=610337 RepID=A0ACC2UWI8_9TREE|nr:hypothetical protein QFC19_009214 [Naganishia cerealis]
MEGLIDNAKKFMASEEGQKMQSTFGELQYAENKSLFMVKSFSLTSATIQGGAEVDQFLGKSSSGDNVVSRDSSNPSYGSKGDSSNQYTEQNQNRQLLDEADDFSQVGGRGQRADTGVSGDTSKADVRERDTDYSGYGGEDWQYRSSVVEYLFLATAEGGWGANLGGDSFSRQNQLAADKPESGRGGQTEGRTGDNETNYDGGRGASGLDASGTSTPAYRQEDVVLTFMTMCFHLELSLNPYGDNSTKMDSQNPLHEQHH